jgi:hypothetical protein
VAVLLRFCSYLGAGFVYSALLLFYLSLFSSFNYTFLPSSYLALEFFLILLLYYLYSFLYPIRLLWLLLLNLGPIPSSLIPP